MKRFVDDDPNGYCCSCKVHIRTGALVVTLLSLAVGVCLTYSPTGNELDVADLVRDFNRLVCLLTSVLGVYAYCQRVAWAWRPITVWNVCLTDSLVLVAIMCLLLHFAAYINGQGIQDAMGLRLCKLTPQAFQAQTAVSAVVLVLVAGLCAWFAMITHRAYEWQKRQDTQNANQFVKVAF